MKAKNKTWEAVLVLGILFLGIVLAAVVGTIDAQDFILNH